MLFDVKVADGYFTALDEHGNKVIIKESLAFLFIKTEDKPGQISYMPITYASTDLLKMIHGYLVEYQPETGLLPRIMVRYGWMDKRLNSLSFKSFLELINDDRNGDSSPTDRRKINEICKFLAISRKAIYQFPKHQIKINPLDVM